VRLVLKRYSVLICDTMNTSEGLQKQSYKKAVRTAGLVPYKTALWIMDDLPQ
jgi:hypothetical protein